MSKEGGAYLRLLAVTALWGSSFPATRLAVIDIQPATIAALRLGLSTVVFILMLLIGRQLTRERVSAVWRKNKYHLLFLGTIGMGYYLALVNYGIQLLGAAQAGMLAPNTFPVLTALLSRLLLQEPLYPRKVAGLILAATGVGLIISAGLAGGLIWQPQGYLFIFLGALGFSLYSVFGPLLMRTMTALEANAWIGLVGTLGLLPWVWWEQPATALASAGLDSWVAIFHLSVVVQALGYLWWYQGIHVIGPSRTVVFTYIVPVWAVTLSLLLLREAVTGIQLLGALMAITGVALVNWQGSATAAKPVSIDGK